MSQLKLMALRHSAFYSPYLLSMAGGYLKDAGFDVEYTVQTPDNLVKDRLLDGSCHVSQSAVAAGFADLEQNQPNDIRHFAQINNRDGFFIAAREPIGQESIQNFDWKQLEGKSVLVDHFFQPMAMFRYALKLKGVDESKIDIIDAGDVDAIDKAFREGKGDFVHQQGPAPQQMEADGVAHVVASVGEAIGPVAFSSLCANKQWLASEDAGFFLNAYQQALAECKNNTAVDVGRKLHSYGFLTEIDPGVLTSTIEYYQQLGCWQHNGIIQPDEYSTLLDIFRYSELISQNYAFNKLITK